MKIVLAAFVTDISSGAIRGLFKIPKKIVQARKFPGGFTGLRLF